MSGEMLSEEDLKEELSLAYVHVIAARVGFSVEPVRRDKDSVDLRVCARGSFECEGATVLSPNFEIQLKATVLDPVPTERFPFELKIKNYNDLVGRTMAQRILVVYAMPADIREWANWSEEHLVMKRSAFWLNLRGKPRSENATKQRVYIDPRNTFGPDTIRTLLEHAARQEDFPS